jgi:hypothetical protein
MVCHLVKSVRLEEALKDSRPRNLAVRVMNLASILLKIDWQYYLQYQKVPHMCWRCHRAFFSAHHNTRNLRWSWFKSVISLDHSELCVKGTHFLEKFTFCEGKIMPFAAWNSIADGPCCAESILAKSGKNRR